MRVCVVTEERFNRTPDGSVWTSRVHGYDFWRRYLTEFEAVKVVGRVRDISAKEPAWRRVGGDGVEIAPVAYYVGPWQYLRKRKSVIESARDSTGPSDAIIFRLHSQLANCIEPALTRTGRPYGVELVTDPYDILGHRATRSILSPFFRRWFSFKVRRQCAGAAAIAYVTKDALQRRYPPPVSAFATYYSSVDLGAADLAAQPRDKTVCESGRFNLITVTTLRQLYKAPDLLIDALSQCVKGGLDLSLTIVGGGKYRPALEARAHRRGVADRVTFTGDLPSGRAVLDHLDKADLFVLPSYQEGLPRAMVEAMARAVPCIGTNVGGIPELLPPEDMVPPGKPRLLAEKIKEVLSDPARLSAMSAVNLLKAKEYRDSVLEERRREMFRHLRAETEEWLTRSGSMEI